MNDFSAVSAKSQRGATLLVVVFLLTGLLGMAALGIDLRLMTLARQKAQNVADAAALAGASVPGGEASAAMSVASANGTDFQAAATVVGPDGAVTVRGYVNAPLSFAPAVGYAPSSEDGAAGTVSVFAGATAAMQAVCSLPPGMPVAPFGLIGDDPASADPAAAYASALVSGTKPLPKGYQPVSAQLTLKLNLWDGAGKLVGRGSFDPLLTSGTGATYFDTIRQTSDQTLAAGQGLTTPPLSYDNAAQTRQQVAARLAPSNAAYSHAYSTYDSWVAAGSRLQPDGVHYADRLLLLPVVRQSVKDKPGGTTTLAFAVFFVDTPFPAGEATNAIVRGRFLGVTVPGASGGPCAGAGGRTPPRLLQ